MQRDVLPVRAESDIPGFSFDPVTQKYYKILPNLPGQVSFFISFKTIFVILCFLFLSIEKNIKKFFILNSMALLTANQIYF